jgi:hypothetical protein
MPFDSMQKYPQIKAQPKIENKAPNIEAYIDMPMDVTPSPIGKFLFGLLTEYLITIV